MAKRVQKYEVGYGRPPLESRFEPGVSGNPKGRPKGSLSVATTLNRLLKVQVEITENGRKKKISKFEAALMKLIHAAYSGNMVAMKMMISIVAAIEQRVENETPKEKSFGRTEQKMLQNMMKRFGGGGKGNAHA